MINLRTILLALIALAGIFTAYAVSAKEFPKQQVQYVCDTAPYYYTTTREKCMLEQYAWYTDVMVMDLTDEHYSNALWYGQKYGYMGNVIGIDFKPVLDRAKYLKGR